MTPRENQDWLLDLASKLLKTGRIPEAIDAHQRLLDLHPNLPDSWYNLAYLQQRARRFDESLASYEEALRLEPDFAGQLRIEIGTPCGEDDSGISRGAGRETPHEFRGRLRYEAETAIHGRCRC